MTLAPELRAIAADPEWFPHRYDPIKDMVHFAHATREEHSRAVFLTDQYLPGAAEPVVLPRNESVEAAGAPAPLHFVFHSAFCGSTLLARAFDMPSVSMGLKEPLIFNDLSGWAQRGGAPRDVAAVLDSALALLARPFGRGEAIIVKPSNLATPFIPAILNLRPQSKALLLEAPLRVFLGSVARKGMEGRLWVRQLLFKLLRTGMAVDLGFAPEDYFMHTDLQAAAVGWLGQHAMFHKVLESHAAQVRSLDSETLTERASEAITALASFYGLPVDPATIAANRALTTHSKSGAAYNAQARRDEREAGEQPHADEIEKVSLWAEAVAANAGLPMGLSLPLI